MASTDLRTGHTMQHCVQHCVQWGGHTVQLLREMLQKQNLLLLLPHCAQYYCTQCCIVCPVLYIKSFLLLLLSFFPGDFFQLLFACCQENVFSLERFKRQSGRDTQVAASSSRRGSRGKNTTPDFMWNITWLDFTKVRQVPERPTGRQVIQIDRWVGGWMDGRTDGRTDGRMDKKTVGGRSDRQRV